MILAQPLAGRRIVVTRARHQAGSLSSALRELGAEVIELPVIEIVPPASYSPLDEALRGIRLYQWLIFTSANAVRVVVGRLELIGQPPSSLDGAQIAAIGPATAAALKSHGIAVNLIPGRYVAESLVEAFADSLNGTRALLIRAKTARDVIPDALRNRGAVVDIIDAYETVMPKDSESVLPALLASVPDAITFTSSSTVTNFLALLARCQEIRPGELKALRAISIGPVTSKTLREAGWEPLAEAAQSDVPGIISAAVRALS